MMFVDQSSYNNARVQILDASVTTQAQNLGQVLFKLLINEGSHVVQMLYNSIVEIYQTVHGRK